MTMMRRLMTMLARSVDSAANGVHWTARRTGIAFAWAATADPMRTLLFRWVIAPRKAREWRELAERVDGVLPEERVARVREIAAKYEREAHR